MRAWVEANGITRRRRSAKTATCTGRTMSAGFAARLALAVLGLYIATQAVTSLLASAPHYLTGAHSFGHLAWGGVLGSAAALLMGGYLVLRGGAVVRMWYRIQGGS